MHPIRLVAIAAIAGLLIAFYPHRDTGSRPAESASVPSINEPSVITFVGDEISLTGHGLGGPTDARSVTFAYDSTTSVLTPISPGVLTWDEASVRMKLPPEVHSGTATITVNGAASAPVYVVVLELTFTSTITPANPRAGPLALAVGQDGRVWTDEEFHRELKAVVPTDPGVLQVSTIPQAPGPGIFAADIGGDARVSFSQMGEDIDVDARGDVWLTEGGGYLYTGANLNTSRILRYSPGTQTFACFNVPDDDAEVAGLLVDDTRGLVWYSESSLFHGNAIGSFSMADTPSDCLWDPAVGVRPQTCGVLLEPGCHHRYVVPSAYAAPTHFAMDSAGRIWFTEYWANAVARFDPGDERFAEIPLPAAIIRQGPGLLSGAGPWEIDIDPAGNIWFTEYFDGTISKIDPVAMAALDCTRLDAQGVNPCVTEVYVGTDGYDGKAAHSLIVGADDRVWFAISDPSSAQVGFIDRARNDHVALTPAEPSIAGAAGIARDGSTGDMWLAVGGRIARLRLAQGDADGVPDAVDNCPTAYNPGQENVDRNFVNLPPSRPFDDLTWPNSDEAGDACDADADNDGIPNAQEAAFPMPGCATSTRATDPLLRDTDGDMVLDGAECRLGSDPANAASVPSRSYTGDMDHDGLQDTFEPTVGTNPAKADTDGDGISDGAEFKYYNSDPLLADTDGDHCADGKEAASLNADRAVSSLDLVIIAQSYGQGTSPKYLVAFDVTKDGAINSGDLLTLAKLFGQCR